MSAPLRCPPRKHRRFLHFTPLFKPPLSVANALAQALIPAHPASQIKPASPAQNKSKMPAPKVLPKYVYKIVDEAPPSPIPDPFPPSELDKQDGFIHLSTSWQVSCPHPNHQPPLPFYPMCRLSITYPVNAIMTRAGHGTAPPTLTNVPLLGSLRLPVSARSKHLSLFLSLTLTHTQIPITASLFFASHTTLWLVKIRYAGDVAASARWDDPPNDNDGCPHLYGRGFGPADVEGVQRFDRDGDGDTGSDWKKVFAASGWLE